MQNKNLGIAVAVVLTAVVSASASPVPIDIQTAHFWDDETLVALLEEPLFVAEGRAGNLASNGTHELDLGPSTSHPADQAHYVWPNGVPTAFTLTYDPVAQLATFELGGNVLTYDTGYGVVSDLFIRTRSTHDNTSILVDGLVLNGTAIDGTSMSDGDPDREILWISSSDINDGFTLAGQATMAWTDEYTPKNSHLAFQISAGAASQPIPEPGTLALLAGGVFLAATRRTIG